MNTSVVLSVRYLMITVGLEVLGSYEIFDTDNDECFVYSLLGHKLVPYSYLIDFYIIVHLILFYRD
jgi:hypothetical protein